MKLKKFEMFTFRPKFQEGDYVELFSSDLRSKEKYHREDELAVISFVRYSGNERVYGVQYLGGDPDDYWEIPEYDVESEIFRKLDDHEVAALKYNL